MYVLREVLKEYNEAHDLTCWGSLSHIFRAGTKNVRSLTVLSLVQGTTRNSLSADLSIIQVTWCFDMQWPVHHAHCLEINACMNRYQWKLKRTGVMCRQYCLKTSTSLSSSSTASMITQMTSPVTTSGFNVKQQWVVRFTVWVPDHITPEWHTEDTRYICDVPSSGYFHNDAQFTSINIILLDI